MRLRDLRQGCLLHTLIALVVLGQPSTKQELADEAGISDEAAQDACRILARPDFGLVVAMPNGRHPLWCLTPNARHFLAPLAAALDGAVMVTPLSADSIGGGSSESIYIESIKTTTTGVSPLPADSNPHKTPDVPLLGPSYPQPVENFLTQSIEPLVAALVATGVARKRVVKALNCGLRRGESVASLAQKFAAGQKYRASPAGRSIRTPYWLVACIEDGRAIPDVAESGGNGLDRYDGYMADGE